MDSLEELLEWMQTEIKRFWDDKKGLWRFNDINYEWIEQFIAQVIESLSELEKKNMPIIHKEIVSDTLITYKYNLKEPMKLYWQPNSDINKANYYVAAIDLVEGCIDYEVSVQNLHPEPFIIPVNKYVLSPIANMNVAEHLLWEVNYHLNRYAQARRLKNDIYLQYTRRAMNKNSIFNPIVTPHDAIEEERQFRLWLNERINQ